MSTLNTYASDIEISLKGKTNASGQTDNSVSFILLYGMKEEAGNQYQSKTFSATVNILATQDTDESDSFGTDYDKNATYEGSVTQTVTTSEDSTTAEPTTLKATPAGTTTSINVTVPSGVKLDEGVTSLTLKATSLGNDPSVVDGLSINTGADDQKIEVYDIKVEGVAENNTEVITVELDVDKDLVNPIVYHNNTLMKSLTAKPSNLTANTYYYDSTNKKLYIYTTGFSKYTLTSGTTIGVSSAEELENAVNIAAERSTIKLATDIESTSTIPVKKSGETKIDLNGKTFTSSTDYTTIISGKTTTLTIENGTLNFTSSSDVTAPNFQAQEGASIVINNCKVNSSATAFLPLGDATSVTIKNSTVVADTYCVGTNAQTLDNYGIKFYLENSTFRTTSSISDDCPVMINVEGTLDIKNCTITGQRQGVIVRAGTATITDSTIKTLGTYTKKAQNHYYTQNWSSGNEVPSAALVVGNDSGNATNYSASAICTLTNTNIYAENGFAKIYMESRGGNTQYSTELTYSGGNVSDSFITQGKNTVKVNSIEWPINSDQQ
jgi:hypothetical protein